MRHAEFWWAEYCCLHLALAHKNDPAKKILRYNNKKYIGIKKVGLNLKINNSTLKKYAYRGQKIKISQIFYKEVETNVLFTIQCHYLNKCSKILWSRKEHRFVTVELVWIDLEYDVNVLLRNPRHARQLSSGIPISDTVFFSYLTICFCIAKDSYPRDYPGQILINFIKYNSTNIVRFSFQGFWTESSDRMRVRPFSKYGSGSTTLNEDVRKHLSSRGRACCAKTPRSCCSSHWLRFESRYSVCISAPRLVCTKINKYTIFLLNKLW